MQLLPGPVDFSKGIFSTSERNSWGLHNKKLMTQFSLCLCLNWDTSIFLKKGLKFESYFLLTPQVGNFLQHRLLGLVWNSVTEYFPSMHEVLNSVFRTKKKKKNKINQPTNQTNKPIGAPNWPSRVWGGRAFRKEWEKCLCYWPFGSPMDPHDVKDYISTIFVAQDPSVDPK